MSLENIKKCGWRWFKKSGNQLYQWGLLSSVELGCLTLLCFIAGRLLSYVFGWGVPAFSGFWVIASALLVSELDNQDLMELLVWRLTAVGIGVLGAFLVLSLFGVHFLSLFLAAVAVSWVCVYLKWQNHQQLAILSLVVVIVAGYLKPELGVWSNALGRFLEAGAGVALAFFVRQIFVQAGLR